MIYHVTTQADWQQQATAATYEAASLQTEGFIHLSEAAQVAGVLSRYYRHIPDRLLLHINPAKLTAPLKYEPATADELFPHLYGPLNKEAIVKVEVLANDNSI